MEKRVVFDIDDTLCHIKKIWTEQTPTNTLCIDLEPTHPPSLKSEGAITGPVSCHLSRASGHSNPSLREHCALTWAGLPIDADKGRAAVGYTASQKVGVGRLTLENQEVIDLLLSLAHMQRVMNSHLFHDQLSSIKHQTGWRRSPLNKKTNFPPP